MKPGPKSDPAAVRERARKRALQGKVARGEGPGVRGRRQLVHSAMEEYAPLIVEMVERAVAEIEQHGIVTRTKRGGGKLNPAFASLKDSLHLLDDIPAIDQRERVERIELEDVIARLELIALT